MLRNLLNVVLIGSILFAPAAMSADAKIGVVDMEKAIMQTTKAKGMSDQFVKDFTKDEEKVKKIEAELTALNEKAMKSGASMSKTEKETLMKQMQSKGHERGEIVKKIKQAEQERLQQLRAAIDPKIKAVMKDVAEKGGYTIIIDRKAAPYFSEADDVTKDTTEKLNQALK